VLKFSSKLEGKCDFCGSDGVKFRYDQKKICSKCAKEIRIILNGKSKETKEDLEKLSLEIDEKMKELQRIKKEKEKYDKFEYNISYDHYNSFRFNDKTEEFVVIARSNNWEGKTRTFDYSHPIDIDFKWRVRNYSELYSYEVKVNSSVKNKSGIGGAIIGGALFGGAGAIVGALAGSKEYKKVYSLQLDIELNEGKEIMALEMLNKPLKPGSVRYKLITNKLAEVIKKLDTIIEENNKSAKKNKKRKISTNQPDYIQELRALKSLLDEGVITKEDYEKKKNIILKI